MAHVKVLVVDPEQEVYEAWKGSLAKHGYELHITATPTTAVALAGAHAYQVAFVAVALLDSSAFLQELCTELPELAIIAALPRAYNKPLPVLASMVHTLTKPCTGEVLCLLLDRTIELLTLRTRLRRQRQEGCSPQATLQDGASIATSGGPLAANLTHQLRQLVPQMRLLGGGSLHHVVLSYVEKLLLTVVLQECRGNQVKSSEILGINRNTLRKKILEYGLSVARSHGENDHGL